MAAECAGFGAKSNYRSAPSGSQIISAKHRVGVLHTLMTCSDDGCGRNAPVRGWLATAVRMDDNIWRLVVCGKACSSPADRPARVTIPREPMSLALPTIVGTHDAR